ncbi:MAG: site-specific recombinase XerD [Crocinitomicaceae bacterium]|jgi:site-specific recombinase XerD
MNITLLLEDFYIHARYMRGVSPTTIIRYRQQICFFFKQTNIDDLNKITKEVVLTFFMNGRMKRNWKSTTYIVYYHSLIVFFRWCVKNGHLSENYVEGLDLPKREKLLPKRLKKEVALKFLETIYNYPYRQEYTRYRNHALFSVFLFSGLRKSEALNLRVQDVDIENLSIFVRQGKGGKDRVVPMSVTLAHTLSKYLGKRNKARKTCPEFFTSSNKNHGFTVHGLKHFVEDFKRDTGFDFTIHKLRHTFATLMLEGGCDIFSLSKMLGHSDIKTTTIYLSASAEHLREQVMKHPMNNVYPT